MKTTATNITPLKRYQSKPAKIAVWEFLADSPNEWHYYRDIAESIGKSYSNVSATLSHMCRDGLVVQHGAGIYELVRAEEEVETEFEPVPGGPGLINLAEPQWQLAVRECLDDIARHVMTQIVSQPKLEAFAERLYNFADDEGVEASDE